MFDFILQPLMTLGTMIMQTSTGNVQTDAVISIVLSVAAILGTIGTILKMFPKTKGLGQMLDAGYQKVAEEQELMKRTLQALNALVPELEPQLKKVGAPLELFDKRAKMTAQQLQFWRDAVVKSQGEKAAAVTQLPREEDTHILS